MELDHDHPPTFTDGYADFYRGCSPCEEMTRLLAAVENIHISMRERTTYGPVTIPNLEGSRGMEDWTTYLDPAFVESVRTQATAFTTEQLEEITTNWNEAMRAILLKPVAPPSDDSGDTSPG